MAWRAGHGGLYGASIRSPRADRAALLRFGVVALGMGPVIWNHSAVSRSPQSSARGILLVAILAWSMLGAPATAANFDGPGPDRILAPPALRRAGGCQRRAARRLAGVLRRTGAIGYSRRSRSISSAPPTPGAQSNSSPWGRSVSRCAPIGSASSPTGGMPSRVPSSNCWRRTRRACGRSSFRRSARRAKACLRWNGCCSTRRAPIRRSGVPGERHRHQPCHDRLGGAHRLG